jgi:hypothetical protein
MNDLQSIVQIESRILMIRGLKVMIDADIANLYGIATKALNQSVKRNFERFPSDFMFQLTQNEKDELVTNCDRFKNIKHSKVLPDAFTEYGALMLANVLNSLQADVEEVCKGLALLSELQYKTTLEEYNPSV